MKVPRLFSRKKLRVSATRRALASPEDYEEMAEPNMKLSRALLIVLVLHVVAVSGIIAFNTIKSRQGAFPPPAKVPETASNVPAATAAPVSESSEPAPAANESPGTHREEAATASALKALPVESDSGRSYVVVKGDNPVKIAKKFKVSESDLLLVNHIDDPRKLQIGQKLIIPGKAKSKK